MKNLLMISVLLLLATAAVAQERPSFFPEDVEHRDAEINHFAHPGILGNSRSRGAELSFTRIGGGSLNPEDTIFSSPASDLSNLQRIELKVRFPILLKDKVTVVLGASYRPERYQFSSVSSDGREIFRQLDGRWLKSTQVSAIANYSFDKKYFLALRGKVALNGDYDKVVDFGSDYRVISLTGVFGIDRSENMEWGFGLNLSTGFRGTRAVPILVYNQNINEKFGVEAALPASLMGRWNVSKNTILLVAAQYNSRSYGLAAPLTGSNVPVNYQMNHSEINYGVILEQHIKGWLWLGLEGGYQQNFSTDFESKMPNAFKVEPTNAPFLKLAVFLSVPDDYEF